MNVKHWMLKSLLVGALGAVLGASSSMFIAGHEPRPVGIAVASGEDDQQRIIEAVKHVEPSVVALDVIINGTRVMPSKIPSGTSSLPGSAPRSGRSGAPAN